MKPRYINFMKRKAYFTEILWMMHILDLIKFTTFVSNIFRCSKFLTKYIKNVFENCSVIIFTLYFTCITRFVSAVNEHQLHWAMKNCKEYIWKECILQAGVPLSNLFPSYLRIQTAIGRSVDKESGSSAYSYKIFEVFCSFYPVGTGRSYSGGKAAGAWSWPLTSI